MQIWSQWQTSSHIHRTSTITAAQASLLDLLFKVPAEGLQNDSNLDHVGIILDVGIQNWHSSHKSHVLLNTLIPPPQTQQGFDPNESKWEVHVIFSQAPLPSWPTWTTAGLQWNVHAEASLAHIQCRLDLGGQGVAHQHHDLHGWAKRSSSQPRWKELWFQPYPHVNVNVNVWLYRTCWRPLSHGWGW